MQQQWIISPLDHDFHWKVDFIQQPVMISSVAGPRRSSKVLPKAKLTPQKVMVTVWWSTPNVIHYSFPSENTTSEKYAQQIGEMHEKLQHCSWHWSTEKVQFFSTTIPKCTLHNQCLKSWMNWAVKFCLIGHIHLTSSQPTTTPSNILTPFCRENTSTNSRRQKMHSKSLSSSEAQIVMLQE